MFVIHRPLSASANVSNMLTVFFAGPWKGSEGLLQENAVRRIFRSQSIGKKPPNITKKPSKIFIETSKRIGNLTI